MMSSHCWDEGSVRRHPRTACAPRAGLVGIPVTTVRPHPPSRACRARLVVAALASVLLLLGGGWEDTITTRAHAAVTPVSRCTNELEPLPAIGAVAIGRNAGGVEIVVVGEPSYDLSPNAPGEPNLENSHGRVIIFERDTSRGETAFRQVATFVGRDAFDSLGYSVAIDGNRIAAGAVQCIVVEDSPLCPSGGYVLVVERDATGTWREIARQHPLNPQRLALFGASVALDGDDLLVGAPWWNTNGVARGAAFLFRFEPQTIVETFTLLPPQTTSTFEFGAAVALRDGVAAVGQPRANIQTGRVQIFREVLGWARAQTLAPPNVGEGEQQHQHFGAVLALAKVGARRTLVVGTQAFSRPGAAFIYEAQELGIFS
jgi:hypothetical protein